MLHAYPETQEGDIPDVAAQSHISPYQDVFDPETAEFVSSKAVSGPNRTVETITVRFNLYKLKQGWGSFPAEQLFLGFLSESLF